VGHSSLYLLVSPLGLSSGGLLIGTVHLVYQTGIEHLRTLSPSVFLGAQPHLLVFFVLSQLLCYSSAIPSINIIYSLEDMTHPSADAMEPSSAAGRRRFIANRAPSDEADPTTSFLALS
jgi:hypothetical protein